MDLILLDSRIFKTNHEARFVNYEIRSSTNNFIFGDNEIEHLQLSQTEKKLTLNNVI